MLAELIGQLATVKISLEPAMYVIDCGRYFNGPGRLPIVFCCTLQLLLVTELLPFILECVKPGEILDRFFVQFLHLQEQVLFLLPAVTDLSPICRFLGVELDDPLGPPPAGKVRVLQVAFASCLLPVLL